MCLYITDEQIYICDRITRRDSKQIKRVTSY